jgi:hypothetical protein
MGKPNSLGVPPHYTLVRNEDGEWVERSVGVDGDAAIKVRLDISLRSLPYAEEVILNLPRLMADLRLFIEANALSGDADRDIARLQADAFEFFNKERPNLAEAVFKQTSDGKIWACADLDGKFFNLGFAN